MIEYRNPNRLLLICSTRVGATMLCHLLDSHPSIFMTRGEILHKRNPIRALNADGIAIVNAMLDMPGYSVNGVKLTYTQFEGLTHYDVMPFLPLFRVLHLKRRNILRSIVSDALRVEYGRRHTYSVLDPAQIQVDPDEMLKGVRCVCELQKLVGESIEKQVTVINLFYEDIVARLDNGQLSTELSAPLLRELGVSSSILLRTATKAVNPLPLRDIVTNFDELVDAFKDTEFEWMVSE